MNEPGFAVRALTVLWPAFVAAALIDGLVFSLVDPLDLQVFDMGTALDRPAIYTLAFVCFWVLTSAAGATTMLLCEARERGRGRGPSLP